MSWIGKGLLLFAKYIEDLIVVVCMFGIVVLTFTAVVARYVFSMPIAGADEVATYMFLWASLFAASAAFKYNKHGGVPLLVDLLPESGRRVVDLFILFFTACFFAFLSYYCWVFLKQSYQMGQTSPATGIPVWVVNAGIFLSLSLCSIRCLVAIARDLMGFSRYEEVPVSKSFISEDNLNKNS